MWQKEPFVQLFSAIISVIILLSGTALFFWKAGFFDKAPECGPNYLLACQTQEMCENKELYWWDNACHIEKEPQRSSEYPDFDTISNMEKLVLVEDFISFSPDGGREDGYTLYDIISIEGEITKGYLEVIASIDDGPFTKWESIYTKINYNSEYHYLNGGHLFRPNSLKVPPSEKTHLLYALNDIPFIPTKPYSESKTPEHADWFQYFNPGATIYFMAFISSLNSAKIESITIYYQCKEGSECAITVD